MLSLVSYLAARFKEPGSIRGIQTALGFTSLFGISISSQYIEWGGFGLMLVATVVQLVLAERAKVIAALPLNAPAPTVSDVVWQSLTDAVKSGPQLETLAKQLLDLHAAGSISASDLTSILQGVTVPAVAPVLAVAPAPPSPPAVVVAPAVVTSTPIPSE